MTNQRTVPAADSEYPAAPDARSAGASASERLAEEWCDLNRARNADRGVHLRMAEIEESIGIRACLREWNRGAMTDADFEAWWRRRGKGLVALRFFPAGGTTL